MKKLTTWLATGYLLLLCFAIFIVMVFMPEHSVSQDISQALEGPGWQHPLGTDSLGRSLLARVLSGGFVSLSVGLGGTLLAGILGISIGALAGQNGRWVDRLMMRFTDIFMSIPGFIVVAVFTVLFTDFFEMENQLWGGVIAISLSIGLTHWMQIARLTRAKVLELRGRPFIEAAQALGASPVHIFFRHLFPNFIGTILVLVAAQIPSNIIYESFLSFVGLGMQPPDTSWGVLIREGWKSLSTYPHLVFVPSFVLFGTIWSIHILIDNFKSKFHL